MIFHKRRMRILGKAAVKMGSPLGKAGHINLSIAALNVDLSGFGKMAYDILLRARARLSSAGYAGTAVSDSVSLLRTRL